MDLLDFLDEDVGFGDVTSDALIRDEVGKAYIAANQDCVLAGLEDAVELFEGLGLECEPLRSDGDRVVSGEKVLRIEGPLRALLLGERVALNIMMRMSGIATVTRDTLEGMRSKDPSVVLAATRKTTPGFRAQEKRAVVIGGGDPHRMRLDDAVLIKDNHLRVVGSVTKAVAMARAASFTKRVEVEVETMDDAREAAEASADIIMLDNMSPSEAKRARDVIRAIDGRIVIEISGGITPENVMDYVGSADVISMGYLTHSAPAAHFHLEVEEIL